MRHPTRFWSPAFLLGVLVASTLIACAGAAANSDRSKAEYVRPTAITAGVGHTCALTRPGAVKCWGDSSAGLPPGSWTPVDIRGLWSGVTAISAGVRHSCAVTSVGGAKCWGANYHGALGDGTDERGGPVDVSGLSNGVRAVAAGYDYSCALLGTGGVKCWGSNASGKLGDGTGVDRFTPVDVIGLSSGVRAISTGFRTSCVVMATGGVKCWGYGYGPTAVDISGLSGVTAISAKGPICVLTDAGAVKCRGGDFEWTPVPGLSNGVIAVATNGHGCALTSAHGVKCWGPNDQGQLGDGTTSDRSTPVDVSGLGRGVIAIAAGGFHSCAVTAAGGAKCWGSNASGALGDGTETRRLRPVDVVGFGPPPLRCIVPNVLGKPLAKARARIVRAHCRVGSVTRVKSLKKKNTVVRQSPRPGKHLKQGARVKLEVSRDR